MNKAIKYRLYPTTEQEMMFAKTFGCCRKVYNLMLADKISCYQETKSFGKQTPAMYKADYPFLKEVDSLALANVQLNLQSAMKSCFDKSLDMKAMANKGFGNGKATLDNGYGMFLNMLEYKLSDRGKYFIKVDKWYPSSQICSCCGRQKKLTLADRIYKCDCGLSINQDYNAAINIRNEGLRMLKSA